MAEVKHVENMFMGGQGQTHSRHSQQSQSMLYCLECLVVRQPTCCIVPQANGEGLSVATSEGSVPQLQEVEGGYDAPPDTALGPLHTSPVSHVIGVWGTTQWVATCCCPW